MNIKETILIVVIIILAGLNYYLFSNLRVCNNTVKDLGGSLEKCGNSVGQAQSGIEQCMTDLVKCRNNIE